MEEELIEIISYCQKMAEELKGTNMADIPLRERMAHFDHIGSARKETYVEVGHDARIKIHYWCFDYLSRRGWTHLISVSQCAERVEDAIAFRIFKRGQKNERRIVSKIIHGLDTSIQVDKKPHRFLWPCHICYGEVPAEFSIGPVRFRPTKACRGDLDAAIASWANAPDEYLQSRINGFYDDFGWIADVTVETADKAAAKRMSILAVQTALTSIKMLMAKGGTENRIRTSEEQNFLLEKAQIYFVAETPSLTWSSDGGKAPFADDWWESISQGDNGKRLAALERIIWTVVDPAQQTFLKLKYLGAMRWFNDATLEPHAGARIAKFVTVLETLTGCNERDILAEAVSERVALFVAPRPGTGDAATIRADVKRIYAIRSELVHGVRDPIGLELGPVAIKAAHMAHMTLVSFLEYLIGIGIDRDDYDHSKLLRDFLGIKARAEGEADRPAAVPRD